MKALRLYALLLALGIGAIVPLASLATAQEVDLPDGPGKKKLIDSCTSCHGEDFIVARRRTAEEWDEIMDRMIILGASLGDKEQAEILAYLRSNFGKS